MDNRPDGRLYSRITRKSVAIISRVEMGRLFTINELAEEISNQKIPEFFLKRFNRQLSTLRTRDYIRFLRDINAFEERGDKFTLSFNHSNSDGEWAQGLSDLAFEHISRILGKNPPEVPGFLEQQISGFFERKQYASLDGIANRLGIEGGREQEVFKWCIYLYTDGETSPFIIRYLPILMTKKPIRGD